MPVWLNQDEHLTCNQTHGSSNLLSGFMVPRPRQRGAVLVRRSRWVQFPLAPSKWETWCKRKHGRPWTCRSGVRSPPSPLTTEWQRRYALPRKGSQDRCKSGLRHKAASPTGRQLASKASACGFDSYCGHHEMPLWCSGNISPCRGLATGSIPVGGAQLGPSLTGQAATLLKWQ
jgi:hypothetical protein